MVDILKFLRFFVCLVIVYTVTLSPAAAQQSKIIDVTVSGIDDPLLANVLSGLCLFLQQNNERMTDSMVRKCYDMSEEDIKKTLEPFGYYSPVIDKTLTRDGSMWKAAYRISPGDPVRITELEILLEGDGKEEPQLAEIISHFPLQQGDILDHQLYEQGKKKLSAIAVADGYRDAVFSRSIVQVDRQKYTARILLTLDTGPRYLFGKTTFVADFMNEGLLQRMLPYAEGDSFSPRKIIQMRQVFLNSDYFSKVDVKTGDVIPGTSTVPVSISLSPKNPNKYGLGIGYGTDTGVRGSLEWTNRLLNQYGHQLNIQLQPSERKSNFGMVYTIPIRDPLRDRLALLGKWETEDYDNTKTEARNVSISYDHIKDIGDYSIYLEYLDEDYEVGLDNGHAILLHPGIKSTWRLADDRLRTKNGISATLNLTGSSEEVVSNATFLQASLYSKAILTFFEKWRLIGRFQIGGTLVDTLSDLPPSLRFYAGGDQSVRGYAYKSIGPTDSEGNVVGAKHLVVYSVEVERQLFGNWSGALFFDSGDAPDALTDLNMKKGAGVGVRWNAPFGQVRLDVAKAISEEDNSWRIHFTVGADL